jgi:hypothetical protein
MLKKILILLAAGLIIIQFFRPAKNLSNDLTHDITTRYSMPAEVRDILKTTCYDCHSNKTEYPWYSYIQPVAWWLNGHITGGKRHLNYSTFASLPIANQNRKFEQTIDQVDKKEMPIASYTYLGLHSKAKLTDSQRQIIIDWARAQMDTLKTNYPPDSLVVKRRPRPPATKS